MPDAVDDCVESIKADNPDIDEEQARAICNDMQNRGVLEAFNDADAEVDRAVAALASFHNPGNIQRVEEGGDIRYKRICLLAPGVWTDAGSRETILYDGDAIRESADDWVDNQVNLLHGPALHGAESLAKVGEVDLDTLVVDDQDRLFSDIVLHGDTPASELAVELMDEALETGGAQGIDGPSVEIVDDAVEFDGERGLSVMTSMTFGGIGLVFNPASEPVELGNQIRERAVAMADAEDVDTGGVVMRPNATEGDESGATTQSLKTEERPGGLMADERTEVTNLLSDIGEAIEETKHLLQDTEEFAMVQDLIATYEQEGGDLSAPVTEFVGFLEGEGVDMETVQGVLDAYLNSVEAESLEETPVAELNEWVQEAAGQMDEEGRDEPGEGEEATMTEEDLEEAKQTIAQFQEQIGDVKDMLSGVVEDVEEVSDEVEDVDKRLSKIEDEPKEQQRSLSRPKESDFVDTEGSQAEHEDAML